MPGTRSSLNIPEGKQEPGTRNTRACVTPTGAPGKTGTTRRRGTHAEAQAFLPSADCADPGYRRLHYARYADDTLFGFTGPKAEAEEIKQRLTMFLRDELHLELSAAKTLITHARTGAAKFLGYEITTQHGGTSRPKRDQRQHSAARARAAVIKAKCAPYPERGKPAARRALQNLGDYDIVAAYGANTGASASTTCSPATPTTGPPAVGHGDLAAQDARGQAPLDGEENGGQYKAAIETPPGPRNCLNGHRARGQRSHWSPGSAASPSGECAQPPSPTSGPSWPAPSGTS